VHFPSSLILNLISGSVAGGFGESDTLTGVPAQKTCGLFVTATVIALAADVETELVRSAWSEGGATGCTDFDGAQPQKRTTRIKPPKKEVAFIRVPAITIIWPFDW
jgi:hypothetical protein